MIVVSKTGEPWQLSSTMSSPVKEWGDLKYVIKAWSRSAPVYGSKMDRRVVVPGVGMKLGSLVSLPAIERESGPLRRMTPMPLRPGGVERATMEEKRI